MIPAIFPNILSMRLIKIMSVKSVFETLSLPLNYVVNPYDGLYLSKLTINVP